MTETEIREIGPLDRIKLGPAEYVVRARVGWGWEVLGPGYRSAPIGNAVEARKYAAWLSGPRTTEYRIPDWALRG